MHGPVYTVHQCTCIYMCTKSYRLCKLYMHEATYTYFYLIFTVQMLLDEYEERFYSEVHSHAILQRLEMKRVIPNDLAFEIERKAVKKGNTMLFLHLREHGDMEALLQFCDITVGMDGYPRMHRFGQCFKDSMSQHLQAAAPQDVRLDTPQDTPCDTAQTHPIGDRKRLRTGHNRYPKKTGLYQWVPQLRGTHPRSTPRRTHGELM